jgi:hypothetical protein
MGSEVLVLIVAAAINDYSKDDEDLRNISIHIQ